MSESKKIKKSRVIKEPVSPAIINKLKKLTIGYGKLKEFADKADLNYNTVHKARETGQATPSVKRAIKQALAA